MNWIEEAKGLVESHGLPTMDFSHWGFTSENGAINTFTENAMTKGSHPDGRMTVEEVQSLLLWILARHKHNFITAFDQKTSQIELREAIDMVSKTITNKKYKELTDVKEQLRIMELAFVTIYELKESYRDQLMNIPNGNKE